MTYPTSPAGIDPEIGLTALVDAYLDYLDAAANGPHRAIAALAVAHAAIDRLNAPRWMLCVRALDGGASVSQAADATGLTPPELQVGVTAWSHVQHLAGRMTTERYDAIRELIGMSAP